MPPSRKRTTRLKPEAEQDFADILQYTEERWGFYQREAYAEKLVTAFESISAICPLRDNRKPSDVQSSPLPLTTNNS